MKSIWKYAISVTDHQTLAMPRAAIILCAQFQGDQLCIWAEVDVGAPVVERSIYVRGTGHEYQGLPGQENFVGTVQQGPFVWHVFAGYDRP